MTREKEKESVQQFWDAAPCGTRDVKIEPGTKEYFDSIARHRYQAEYFIPGFAEFSSWKGRKVLEVGCGAGTDLLSFAINGAQVTGMDLSPRSAGMALSRLRLYGCGGDVINADAENLPFNDDSFDLVYSWGVLHHTPDTQKAVAEVHRVLAPGGNIRIMLYHRRSLVAAQLYLMHGLLALKPQRDLAYIFSRYHESPGTKAYTVTEIRQMFSAFKELDVRVQLTCYDLRYARDKYLPRWAGNIVPRNLGFFILISGRKA